MRNLSIFMLLLLVVPAFSFAAQDVATIEGVIDLSKSTLVDWQFAGHYKEKFKVRVSVRASASGAARMEYSKVTETDEGEFRHDYCQTSLHWQGGEIEAQLIDLVSGAVISQTKKPMTLSGGFRDPTTEWATCYPHDFANFTQTMNLTWDFLELKIDESRTLRVRPFAFLDSFTLWGTGSATKQNGQYILQNFSIADGLKDLIYDSSSSKNIPALSYLPWDHFNLKHVMPLPGQADASGTHKGITLLP